MRRDALLVGTTSYADPVFSTLVAPATDVHELHHVLTSSDIGQFTASEPMLNQRAQDVKERLETFFADRSSDDLLLFYFSGHGIVDDEGQLYLAASNTDRKKLRSTAIEASFVRALMDSCRSETQLLVLDCCHSGAFGRTKGTLGSPVETERAFGGKGRIVLTASDATQLAFEGQTVLGNTSTSLFTHFLVQGLRTGEADLDGDGLISVDELYLYAHEHVSRRTNAQTPSKSVDRQQGSVMIARNASPKPRPDLLSPELLRCLDSPERSVQKGAMEGLAEHLRGSHPGRALAAREILSSLQSHDSKAISEFAARLLDVSVGQGSSASKEESPSSDVRAGAPSQPEPVTHTVREAPRDGAAVGGGVRGSGVFKAMARSRSRAVVGAVVVVAAVVTAIVTLPTSNLPANNSESTATQPPEAASPAPVATSEAQILADAKALMADGSFTPAHRKVNELPADSALRKSADFIAIERRWGESVLDLARSPSATPDMKRRFLQLVIDAPSVDDDLRASAEQSLASLDDANTSPSTAPSKPTRRTPKKPSKAKPNATTGAAAVSPAPPVVTPSTTAAAVPAPAGTAVGSNGLYQPGTIRQPVPNTSMSAPSAVAFPCQNDAECQNHRCNVTAGRCAWPCQSNADCQPGFQCNSPACIAMAR